MPRRTTKTPTPAPPTEPDLVRILAAANMLGASERFMRRLVAERRIRYYKIGSNIHFDPADVLAYKIASRVESTNAPLPIPNPVYRR